MLAASDIQQRFTSIRNTIGEAEQACQSAGDTSPELREQLQKLSSEAASADPIMGGDQQERIVECIDRLEDMGDEVKRLSRSDQHMTPTLESAVTRVHAELSKLKHELH